MKSSRECTPHTPEHTPGPAWGSESAGPGPHALGGWCYQHRPGGRSGSHSERLERLRAGAGHSARSIHWGMEAQFPARRREERGCRPVTGKDRAICQSGGAPALRPGAIAQSPGREAALAWASPAKRFPASSVLARAGAGCGSAGDVTGAWLAPTLCHAIDGSPPGSPVPGILQALYPLLNWLRAGP